MPRTESGEQWFEEMHNAPTRGSIVARLISQDQEVARDAINTLNTRSLKCYNTLLTLRVVVHSRSGMSERQLLIEAEDSTSLTDIERQVRVLLETPNGQRRQPLLWLTGTGHTEELISHSKWKELVHTEWCYQPLTIHAFEPSVDASTDANKRAVAPTLMLKQMATDLFHKFDENHDGQIDAHELEAMLKGLDRSALEVSEDMIERFVHTEILRADGDTNGTLDLHEFCKYISKLSRWARQQLLERNDRPQLVSVLAERAVETSMEPRPPSSDSDEVAVVRAHGLSVRVPPTALPHANGRLALSTLSVHQAEALHEATKSAGSERLGEFPFTPLVRVSYEPQLGGEINFNEPLELSMPHCFDPEEGSESLVMLCCREGERTWRVIDALTIGDGRNPVELSEESLKVRIPYPGLFCGFSSPQVEDICRVRLTIRLPPAVQPGRPFTVRVGLCPLLPTKLHADETQHQAEWGQSISAFELDLSLYQGTALELTLQGVTQTISWHGLPCGTAFSYTPRSTCGNYIESLWLKVIEGTGRRAGRTLAAAKRAGIPAAGKQLEFEVNPRGLRAPAPPSNVAIFLRSQWDVTIEWDAPNDNRFDSGGQVVYAIELSTCGKAGTYRPYEAWWEGDGPCDMLEERTEAAEQATAEAEAAASRSFRSKRTTRAEGAPSVADSPDDSFNRTTRSCKSCSGHPSSVQPASQYASSHSSPSDSFNASLSGAGRGQRQANAGTTPASAASERMTQAKASASERATPARSGATSERGTRAPKKGKRSKKTSPLGSASTPASTPPTVRKAATSASTPASRRAVPTTEIPGTVAEPSTGVTAVGTAAGDSSAFLPLRHYAKTLEAPCNLFGHVRIRCWFEGVLQPSEYVTLRLKRYIGKMEKKSPQRLEAERKEEELLKAEREKARMWAAKKQLASTICARESNTANEKKKPYQLQADLLVIDPPLPNESAISEAVNELGGFVAESGDLRGVGGTVCGMRVAHVVRAILLGRTCASIRAPLVALAEVLLVDAIAPLEQRIDCLREEWSVVLERLNGHVALLSSWQTLHERAAPYVRGLLTTMIELWETLRHCQPDMYISLNLREPEYSAALRKELRDEATAQLVSLCWCLSTAMLKLHVHLKHDVRAEEETSRFAGGRSALERARRASISPQALVNGLFQRLDPFEQKQVRRGLFAWMGRVQRKAGARVSRSDDSPTA